MTTDHPDSLQGTGREWLPSEDQPTPQSLGDFLKLLGSKTKAMDAPASYYVSAVVNVVGLAVKEDLDFTFRVIQATMSFSPSIWFVTSRGGDLGRCGTQPEVTHAYSDFAEDPRWSSLDGAQGVLDHMREIRAIMDEEDRARWASDDWIEDQSYKILNLMWLGGQAGSGAMHSDWRAFRHVDAPRVWSAKLQQTLLLLAATLCCQLPLSALHWVRERFVPVAAAHNNTWLLCLLSKSACDENLSSGQKMFIVGRHVSRQSTGQDLVLATPGSIVPVGLVPDFLSSGRKEEDFMEYMVDMTRYELPKSVKEMRSAMKAKTA
jgi:hypothetical protein